MANSNNIKLFTDELDELNSKYYFTLDDEFIYTHINNYKRVTKHSRFKKFTLLILHDGYARRITFTPRAIELWSEIQNKYSLFDVQHCCNLLQIIYQPLYKVKLYNELKKLRKEQKENEED